MNRLFAIFVLFSTTSLALHAASSPEEIAIRYFEAFKSGNAEAIASCMHGDELTKMKEQMLPVLRHAYRIESQAADLETMALKQMLGADDMDAIENESSHDFFVRFMKWVILRNPELHKAMASATMRAVGHVPDGEQAHVVCKVEVNVMGAVISQMKVMTAKKDGDGWLMALTDEIEGIAKIMQRRIGRGGM